MVHDAASGDFVVSDSGDQSYRQPDPEPSLTGEFSVTLANGSVAAVKTVWTKG
ncbi:MAG: hypothetical protein U5K27_14605 [Desulfotignum sp.]|nr:hypothetical protein [Desulfotignum sp.]